MLDRFQANQGLCSLRTIEAIPTIVGEDERLRRRMRTDIDCRAQFVGAKRDHVPPRHSHCLARLLGYSNIGIG